MPVPVFPSASPSFFSRLARPFRSAPRTTIWAALPLVSFLGAAALPIPAAAAPAKLFKSAAIGTPDTLEVFVLYVEFASEELSDEKSTTGWGTFGSDKDKYDLDPNGSSLRRSAYYLTKRFEFAQDYFDKVSGGRVVIKPRIFPAPNANNDSLVVPIRLSKRMKAYNPALEDKKAKQKTSDFAVERAVALMSFVSETADKYDVADPATNPFKIAHAEALANPSSKKHRAFLIFHAGHSRLVDGGTLGYLGANTPNDFTDFFVTKPDFQFLANSTNAALKGDSLGIVTAAGDTITQFMMLSESASQDKINWGINGILINQLARQMGLPDLFDVVKGISSVGTFDVMDFAGYNSMQGFLPVFPSAWVRTFMGWDDPVVARPADAGNNTWSDYRLNAADQPAANRVRTVKVPINEREYLLVENRQRSAGKDSVTVWFSLPASDVDYRFTKDSSVTVAYNFLDSLFLDSLCTGTGNNPCATKTKNPRRPRGVITRASNYDAGLPGNGMLVWHVNEWFLEQILPSGAVNAWLGDTLRNQYKGLELVEADGVPSVGKEFSDPLGQPAFDYGTARDMLPHIFRKRKNPPKDTTWSATDTLSVIGSYGFANTNAWNDGRTHITLEGLLPASPALARGVSSFSGDSVFTFRDTSLTLRVHWADNNTVQRPTGSRWPVRTAAAGNPRAVNVLRDGSGRAYVISAADSGLFQTYTALGRPALASRDTVRDQAFYDSVHVLLSSGNTRPDNAALVNSMVNPGGIVLGSAVAADSLLFVLTPQGLRAVHARADSLNVAWDPDTTLTLHLRGGNDTLFSFAGKAGPMVWGGRVFALDSANNLRWWNANLSGTDGGLEALPAGNWQTLAGVVFGTGSDSSQVLVAGRTSGAGALLRMNPSAPAAPRFVALNLVWGSGFANDSNERYSVTVADFDRDGSDDALLLGSRGAALIAHVRADKAGQTLSGWPQRLPRRAALVDSFGTYYTEDASPPALADLNGDHRPDIVFTGANGVYAYDWHGAVVRGWPFRPQPHQEVGLGYSNRNYLSGAMIGSTPLALTVRGATTVLVASPDGLVYAVDSNGRAVSYSSLLANPAATQGSGKLMSDQADWPLSVGGLSLDSNRSPFVHISLARLDTGTGDLNLIAQTATGLLSVWNLGNARGALAGWLMPGGDAGRAQRLDLSALALPAVEVDREAIEEFHLYPSPLRGGIAKIHLKIGAPGTIMRLRVYDLSGRALKDQTFALNAAGLQPVREFDLRSLGPDVYSVLCEVTFAGGKKTAWQRLGVVK